MKARKIKPITRMVYGLYLCRLPTVPAVDGYGTTPALARASALEKAQAGGHKVVVRYKTLYVLES